MSDAEKIQALSVCDDKEELEYQKEDYYEERY